MTAFGDTHSASEVPHATHAFDVVVYAATASGALAAIAAANEGMRVALIEPGQHVGGMVSGGLGHTDYGDQRVIGGMCYGQRAVTHVLNAPVSGMERMQGVCTSIFGHNHMCNRSLLITVIGGMAQQLYERIARYYARETRDGVGPEPHVAEHLLRTWLMAASVTVIFNARLDHVVKHGRRITQLVTERGDVFTATMVIESTKKSGVIKRQAVAMLRLVLASVGSRDTSDGTWLPNRH